MENTKKGGPAEPVCIHCKGKKWSVGALMCPETKDHHHDWGGTEIPGPRKHSAAVDAALKAAAPTDREPRCLHCDMDLGAVVDPSGRCPTSPRGVHEWGANHTEFVSPNGLHNFQRPMTVEDLARHTAAIQEVVAAYVKDHVEGEPRLLYMAIAGWLIGHVYDLETMSPSRVSFAVDAEDSHLVRVFERMMGEVIRTRSASIGKTGGAS